MALNIYVVLTRLRTFFEETSRRAEIAQNMMNKMEEANGGEIVDAKPAAA